MEAFQSVLNQVNAFVWGPVMLVLLLGTGIYLTVGLRFMPIRRLGAGFRLAFSSRTAPDSAKGEITPFQALATALSATVGTGNIGGVATAIFVGGPGAIFWMWMTALFGMATKYAEAVLAVKYREVDEDGRFVGGPMYYIKNGMGPKWAWLGAAFAFFAMIAGFGIGNMFQANNVALVMKDSFSVPPLATGLLLSIGAFAVIIGGIKSIAYVAERLVPFMAVAYVTAALIVIFMNISYVPAAIWLIVDDAFTGSAAAGGFAGAAVMQAIRFGVARGIFSNEAGLGSAAIAHAAARTNNPVRQGTVAMLGTFIDTIIVCTMTALVILTVQLSSPAKVSLLPQAGSVETATAWRCPSGDEQTAIDQGTLAAKTIETSTVWHTCAQGASMTRLAFSDSLFGGEYVVVIGLIIFAFTTILGWSYYGERAAEYLLGTGAIIPYRLLWVAFLTVGATWELDLILLVSDTFNALMAVPNLIALLALSGTIFAVTKAALDSGTADKE